jgi:branched-chain amino acid transport system substrate-binding protein
VSSRATPLLVALLAAALLAAGCGGGGGNDRVAGVQALPSSSCQDVEYGGQGNPTALIATDLPMQGDSAERSKQQVEAVRLVLDREGWKAGASRVALQVCDDSVKSSGEWDETKCKANAAAYAADPDLIGVIGTYNSGCAEAIIPILNQAPDGGLAMVSPGNTLVCLTQASKTCSPDQPGAYYPAGKRNYARVVPNDAAQGAGLAEFAQGEKIVKPFILYAAGDPTSKGQAETFRGAAGKLGLQISGFEPWDPDASDYAALMGKVKSSGADAVLLAGLLDQNGAQLIKDKVSVLGPNTGPVRLLAPDGFAQQSTIDQAGPASKGMFVSVPGRSPQALTRAGKALVGELEQGLDGKPVELYAPYAGEAAEVLLNAIEPSPKRADVIAALFQTRLKNGIVGKLRITASGDPSDAPVTVSVAGDSFATAKEITPPPALVLAARGG